MEIVIYMECRVKHLIFSLTFRTIHGPWDEAVIKD